MRKLTFILLAILVLGCSKNDPKPPVFDVPESVTLIFPFENSACNEGTNLTDQESTVRFEWFSSDHTEEYELFLTNLITNEEQSFTTTEVILPIVLNRSTPYSWYVESKNTMSDSTSRSETWKFYNAGVAEISYAPFPADAVSPSQAATLSSPGSNILLTWSAADIDDDIEGFDIYFGTDPSPPLHLENVPNPTLQVNVSAGNIYYWRIITRDQEGHESVSRVFQFKVI